jgi:hypothetical protein
MSEQTKTSESISPGTMALALLEWAEQMVGEPVMLRMEADGVHIRIAMRTSRLAIDRQVNRLDVKYGNFDTLGATMTKMAERLRDGRQATPAPGRTASR